MNWRWVDECRGEGGGGGGDDKEAEEGKEDGGKERGKRVKVTNCHHQQ